MRSGPANRPIRYNREYFGYLVGYPEGDIALMHESAEDDLRRGLPLSEMQGYLLPELEVRDGFHLATPPLVWIELTRRCNLECPHCYIDGGDARRDEMSTGEFRQLLDELSAMGVWSVAFTGGEPTLHPGFSELVNYARQLGLLVGVATHGLFLTRDLLDTLPRDGVIISVSLDDLHLIGAQAGVEFQAATRAILRSQEMGFLTNVMTNTNSRNLAHLPELMGWAKANGVSVRSIPFSPLGRGKKHSYLQNSPDDVEKASEFWLQECEWEHEYHKKAGLCVGLIFNYGLSLAYMTRRCSSGRFLAYVAADGTLYPCTMCAGEQILSPGSLRTDGFERMWRAHWEIRDYCWDNFASTCTGCIVNDPAYYCASRCPAMSYARHGVMFGCGASDFEKLSTIIRTASLQHSPSGQYDGVAAVSGVNAVKEGSFDSLFRILP